MSYNENYTPIPACDKRRSSQKMGSRQQHYVRIILKIGIMLKSALALVGGIMYNSRVAGN